MRFRTYIFRFLVLLTLFACVPAMHSQENRRVRVINHTSSPVRYFYASNVDRGTWEEDLLGPGVMIYVNASTIFNVDDGTGHCNYDFKAVLLDGRSIVRRGVNVCVVETWTLSEE